MCTIAEKMETKADKRENKIKSQKKMEYAMRQEVLIKNHRLSNAENKKMEKIIQPL